MKLFIWEGNGISEAWHDDGTLVVLAETAEQARELVRQNDLENRRNDAIWDRKGDDLKAYYGIAKGDFYAKWPDELREAWSNLWKDKPERLITTDGQDSALDREPDRIVEIDKPVVVAFNGGGYD